MIGASYTNGIVGPAPESPEAALSADYVAAVRVDDCLPPDMPVDLIKIDVEGHEFRALSGARRTIERYHPVILTEFSLAGLEANSRVSGPRLPRANPILGLFHLGHRRPGSRYYRSDSHALRGR